MPHRASRQQLPLEITQKAIADSTYVGTKGAIEQITRVVAKELGSG
ncbi:hypothetical protein [Fischerella sp. PCC 9605]|nr:hypothetical protein [Fischerella sp. PCC 9605]